MDDLPVNGHVWVPQSLVSLCFFMGFYVSLCSLLEIVSYVGCISQH